MFSQHEKENKIFFLRTSMLTINLIKIDKTKQNKKKIGFYRIQFFPLSPYLEFNAHLQKKSTFCCEIKFREMEEQPAIISA